MSENACSEQEIMGFFKKDFVPIDNIPEDATRRDAICMEARASLLIEANCTGERFPAFMKCGCYTPDGWVFPFPEPFVYRLNHQFSEGEREINWTFEKFIVHNRHILVDSNGHVVSRWALWAIPNDKAIMRFDLSAHAKPRQYGISSIDNFNEIFLDDFKLAEDNFRKSYHSRFDLCSQISPYKTPEQVCRFFGNQPEVFGKLKLSGMWPDRFGKDDIVQSEVCELLGLPSGSFVKAFRFQDRYGDIRMQVMKFYDPETQSKILIPVTSWMRSQFPYNQCFCIPLPEDKQPLYNLDFLVKKETETAILTDSVELADSNQRHAPDGVVFTSFLCSPGRYEQVDWSPLLDKEEIIYMICNHSGISLEAEYLKAQELADFLQDQYDIKLRFIQLKVDYPSCYFKSVEALQEAYRKQPAKISPTGVMPLDNDADFDVQYRKAVEFIHSKPREWWETQADVSAEEKRITDKESKKRIPPAYLLRPFLLRGEASMLYACKSTGKSALALSMASAVVAGKTLFYEKWWTVPTQRDYPFGKVLYLDFENGEKEIRERRIDFSEPYWPQDKGKREQCEANLIIEDMTKQSGKDYSSPENWQVIIDLIDAAKHKGLEGQPVDLLVIDTVSKFTRRSHTTSVDLSDFINKIRGLNMAILLLHHEGSNGEIRGWKSLKDDFYFTLRLYRETDDVEKSLGEDVPVKKAVVSPLILDFWKGRSGIENNSVFEICFDKKWVEYHDSDDSALLKERRQEEFTRIVDHYLKRRLEDQDIFPILGLGRTTYFELKKK